MKWLVIILTAMFTGAKLCGATNWSWWLVFTPLFVYVGWFLLLLTIAGIIGLVCAFMDDK